MRGENGNGEMKNPCTCCVCADTNKMNRYCYLINAIFFKIYVLLCHLLDIQGIHVHIMCVVMLQSNSFTGYYGCNYTCGKHGDNNPSRCCL